MGPLLPSSAYPGALRLDGFDVQAVLHSLAGAAGLGTLLRALATRLSAGLSVPILLEQGGAEVHVIALLLGDMGIWAVDRFHMLPERAGVRVSLGAAWDLANVGFLGREAGLHHGRDTKTASEGGTAHSLAAMPDALVEPGRHSGEVLDLFAASALWMEPLPSPRGLQEPSPAPPACHLPLKVSMWSRNSRHKLGTWIRHCGGMRDRVWCGHCAASPVTRALGFLYQKQVYDLFKPVRQR